MSQVQLVSGIDCSRCADTDGVKLRRVPALALALLLTSCVAPPHVPDGRLSLPRDIRVRSAGRIVAVPLEEYVLGSALAEVFPQSETAPVAERIFEVQAVLARSYATSHVGRHRAEGFDLCDGAHCQLYEPARIKTSRLSAIARTAVERTAGTLLAYSARPVEALFHADCGGYTAAADAVWGGPAVPYLVPLRDEFRSATHGTWSRAISSDDLRNILNGDARSRVGASLQDVRVDRRDVSGRAIAMSVSGPQPHQLRGEDFRAILNQRLGQTAIQSTRFAIRRNGRTYIFEGTGHGHGVGLCQLGAAARARAGESPDRILETYFHGATLVKVGH